MTIGIDTNILIRFITNDDPDQADLVEALFESLQKENATFLVNEVVLAELDWVLTHVYKYSKEGFLKTINQLFETENIAFHNPHLVKKACKLYTHSGADFSDCYISVINNNFGCKTTYTFDKQASQLSSFTLLE